MKVRAKFIGKDSLGYVNGATYELFVYGSFIKLDGTKDSGTCYYESIQSFLSNWKIITQITDV